MNCIFRVITISETLSLSSEIVKSKSNKYPAFTKEFIAKKYCYCGRSFKKSLSSDFCSVSMSFLKTKKILNDGLFEYNRKLCHQQARPVWAPQILKKS